MVIVLTNVLSDQVLRACQSKLAPAQVSEGGSSHPAQVAEGGSSNTAPAWRSGKHTAGTQAALVKNNEQLSDDDPTAIALRQLVLQALSSNPTFFSAALPKRIYPPLFNRYQGDHNAFGNHVDNAIRTHASSAQSLRTDLSFTLFLSDPDSYEGGELVIENSAMANAWSAQRYKLPAGALVLYPSYHLHRVEAVTKGTRLACFSWIESMVRDPQQRALLFELDQSIQQLRQQAGESNISLQLTNNYHNLLRMWAQV